MPSQNQKKAIFTLNVINKNLEIGFAFKNNNHKI